MANFKLSGVLSLSTLDRSTVTVVLGITVFVGKETEVQPAARAGDLGFLPTRLDCSLSSGIIVLTVLVLASGNRDYVLNRGLDRLTCDWGNRSPVVALHTYPKTVTQRNTIDSDHDPLEFPNVLPAQELQLNCSQFANG